MALVATGELPFASRDRPIGVGELLRRAEDSLSRGVGTVWVEGELVEWKAPASGHAYFTLRDRASSAGMVMWRSALQRVRTLPALGERVRVRGRLGVYERDGRMQFYADAIEPAGAGEAAAALERLRAQLTAEGLFAAGRKRALPRLPRRVGVVTSAQGAAVQDILRTLARRFPIDVVIADCVVQGPSAPAQIVSALTRVARCGVDVVIVGRGGGSAGDLAAFNDEQVVRAVVACPVPVVSAVGHEVDLSLCDLAADTRASTPTAAAELIVPVRAELAAALDAVVARLHRDAARVLRSARQELDHEALVAEREVERQLARRRELLARLQQRLAAATPRAQLARQRQALGELQRRLGRHDPGARVAAGRGELAALRARLDGARARDHAGAAAALGQLAARLHALSPLAVLARGFAVVRRHGEPTFVRAAAEVAVGDRLDVQVAEGAFVAEVVADEARGRADA